MKHLIKYAMVSLGSVASYFVYGFTATVVDWWIAVFAAGSLVATYAGLAVANIPPAQRHRATMVARGAMIIEAIYGTLYVLDKISPALLSPSIVAVAVVLAVLHGAAFSILCYYVADFVFADNAPQQQPDAQQQALTMLVSRLESIGDTLATRPMLPQATFERPTEHPAVVAAGGCCSCGAPPLRGQKGTIAQGKQWRCAACGTVNAGKEGSK